MQNDTGPRSCVECGGAIEPRRRARFCSQKCRYRMRDRRRWPGGGSVHEQACVTCGDRFTYVQITKPRLHCPTCKPPDGQPMPKRRGTCKRCGNLTLTRKHHYCEVCRAWRVANIAKVRRERDSNRPNSTARGYGAAHQKLRAQWALRVDRGEVSCARCGRWIAPGTPWDLGHDDLDRSKYSGPEHARCNRATTGRSRDRPRRWRTTPAPARSDRW